MAAFSVIKRWFYIVIYYTFPPDPTHEVLRALVVAGFARDWFNSMELSWAKAALLALACFVLKHVHELHQLAWQRNHPDGPQRRRAPDGMSSNHP
jgi:hypothetical protein